MTTSSFQAAVCIGRFQPLHLGHLAMIEAALAAAPVCVVVMGSAFQARSPKNPFTWLERASMLRAALPKKEHSRIHFLPIRDYYNTSCWALAVQEGVTRLVGSEGIALIGHLKDASSHYLNHFPAWDLMPIQRHLSIDATPIRDAYFDAATRLPLEWLPTSTAEFLQTWAQSPAFEAVRQEWEMLRTYRQAWAAAPYPPIFVTVDAVVRCADHILLVQRGRAPGKGLWALPGGFVEQNENLYQSALRELQEETNLSLPPEVMRASLKKVVVFDHPYRSQRGRTITHAHYFDLGHGVKEENQPLPPIQAGDDAAQAQWMPITDLPALEDQFMDDHFHILTVVVCPSHL
ncbi:MAG: hypothetical protein RIR79_127 [Pseudomonadota bacterium]|jgi:bifunctional NMN adenylyltransferase/nudix hydrolase